MEAFQSYVFKVLYPFRFVLFEIVNNHGGGGGDHETTVSVFPISCMCIVLIVGVLRLFQLEFFLNLQFIPFYGDFKIKK